MTLPVPLFWLGKELARAHQRSAQGRVTVLPILVEDLVRTVPVLRALCDVAEGQLFQAQDKALLEAVPATSDVVRRTAVQAALTTGNGGRARRVVLFEPEPGLLDARYEPDTGAEPSAGERVILAVARAVVHRDLDARELAVITYSESEVDYPFRRCLWSLGVDQMRDLPNNTLRTLIFVAEAKIDIDLHCQTGRGFRFALSGARLLRRHGGDDLQVATSHIARQERPVVFFLGAGFGASSKLPLGNMLRDTAIRRLLAIPDSELVSSEQLGRRFHRWISERDGWLIGDEVLVREDEYARTLTLEQVIRAEARVYNDLPTLQEFRTHHDMVIETPGGAAVDVVHVLQEMAGRVVVVQVNFDRLLERHCSTRLRVFFTDEGFAEAPDYLRSYLAGEEDAIPVLKLHGSIEDLDSCVVSDEQTRRGIGEGKLEALRALLDQPPRLLIYVGVSMRDRDILPVIGSEEFARGLDEVWVSPYLDESVEDFAQGRLGFWEETNRKTIDDRLVTETADAFFGALRRALP